MGWGDGMVVVMEPSVSLSRVCLFIRAFAIRSFEWSLSDFLSVNARNVRHSFVRMLEQSQFMYLTVDLLRLLASDSQCLLQLGHARCRLMPALYRSLSFMPQTALCR